MIDDKNDCYLDSDIEILRLALRELKRNVNLLESRIDALAQKKSQIKMKGEFINEYA